jgi:hypothetical protein
MSLIVAIRLLRMGKFVSRRIPGSAPAGQLVPAPQRFRTPVFRGLPDPARPFAGVSAGTDHTITRRPARGNATDAAPAGGFPRKGLKRKYRSKKGVRPFCEELERKARFPAYCRYGDGPEMRPKWGLYSYTFVLGS